jgi:hypothetical protein
MRLKPFAGALGGVIAVAALFEAVPVHSQSPAAPMVITEGGRNSYCSGGASVAIPTGGTLSVAYIQGSASKAIRVMRATVSATATAATVNDAQWIVYNPGPTGGTATDYTANTLRMDRAADPTTTATVKAYTAAPSNGTFVGVADAFKLQYGTSASAPLPTVSRWGQDNNRSVVLRGTGDFLVLLLNTIPAGASLDFAICWVEE